ncbi:hypothetical protein BD410DRAFT_169101 [Rickenella mellea]|uniref:YEATS domain-containing protein n=1 Tax=Rickenella mellea TaxID=50990 RepID=A0A4Y7Q724_9AGAM|nr:hypothetical protein BD410DRAFT_169101 [Rickenella mellea]
MKNHIDDSESLSVEDEDIGGVIRHLVRDELDIELALRRRLLDTIKARTTWGELLIATLENNVSGGQPASSNRLIVAPSAEDHFGHDDQFMNTAVDTYETTSTMSNFFSQSYNTPFGSSKECSRSSTVEIHTPRPSTPTTSARRHNTRQLTQPVQKLLYIRDDSTSPAIVYKIICPECGRFDFPNIQGLLNHARIKHKTEYGSHDECIQQCATIVPEDDQPWVVEQGIEVTSMSVSLRRLFGMAVGAYERILIPEGKESSNHPTSLEEEDAATHLSRTLGHHKDTPALAPFLKKKPKIRRVNVRDGDQLVNITDSVPDHAPQGVSGWPMAYQPRNSFASAADNTNDPPPGGDTTQALPSERVQATSEHGGSRFHISTRLVISDWSMQIPEEDRKKYPGDVTHKWMLSVRAPAYSLHESRVLSKMTVDPATGVTLASFPEPIVVTEPPFFVMGTTDRPFLASLNFEWAGQQNKPKKVDHWIELDGGKPARPTLGDEQFLDVDLYRNTELLPHRNDNREADWHAVIRRKQTSTRPNPDNELVSVPAHVTVLKTLLPRFPMTMKDVKSRLPPRLPYMLALSVAHLQSMTAGRRKAIEWGCAHALREAYDEFSRRSDPSRNDELQQLTTADVFRWLANEGHFSRPEKRRPDVKTAVSVVAKTDDVASLSTSHDRRHCAICGLLGPGIPDHMCRMTALMKLPAVDVQSLLQRGTAVTPPDDRSTSPDFDLLVSLVEPSIILMSQAVVASLNLSCGPGPGTTGFNTSRTSFTPYAVLAKALEIFVRHVIKQALQVTIPGYDRSQMTQSIILTPSHIVRGLSASGFIGREALVVCLSRLGYTSSG